MKKIALAASSIALIAALAGCTTGTTPPPSPADDRPLIVASTSTYGNIAEVIGGDLVTVTSIISSPDQDPHSFEASAQDQLAISKADLVIENGGGYDPFVDTMVDASGTSANVITATAVAGIPEGENEHAWYSFEAMDALAAELAKQLGEIDPANAQNYTTNYEVFSGEIEVLKERAQALTIDLHGQGAAVTEPVAVYLLEAIGLVNLTPTDFTEAIEEGTDVPPLALQDTLALFTDGRVIVLAYNEQTASPETQQVRTAAENSGLPVVSFTETLPEGMSYIDWMTSNLDALEVALAP